MIAPMNNPLISFQNVYFGYPNSNQEVIHDFSFDIQKGDVVAILGPNGAGKTTLLNLSLGLLIPKKGAINLSGTSIEGIHRKNVGKQIAFVPQTEMVNFEFTVREFLLLGRTPYLGFLASPNKNDVFYVEKALEKTGIKHLENKFVTTLSGGEFQLVLVARALTQDPQILLLDEPTSHLDLANKSQLVKIIRELKNEGITSVLTTHDPQLAQRLANKVILMKKGNIYKFGLPKDVLTTEDLSYTYNVPVEVKHVEEQLLFLW